MNKKMLIAQVKKEFRENKVSFFYTPAAITLFILIMALCATVYSHGYIDGDGIRFNFSSVSGGGSMSIGTTEPDALTTPSPDLGQNNLVVNVVKDVTVFNGIVVGIMYANCGVLYIVFCVVLISYALRCLFDDRKNRDILFWRSMPVSETVNVLVKLGMILLIAPLIMLILNIATTLVACLIGMFFLCLHGIGIGYLFSSLIHGGAWYIPLQIFYELIFSLLMLAPVIGFALFSSAFARKTPFFIFVSPLILILAEKIVSSLLGIKIGVIDIFLVYGRALADTRSAFILTESFEFNQGMLFPLISCLAVGALLVVGAIWLRNNRYEI